MSISMPDSPQLRSSTHTQNRGGRSNIYSSSKCTDGSFSTTHSVLQYNSFSSYEETPVCLRDSCTIYMGTWAASTVTSELTSVLTPPPHPPSPLLTPPSSLISDCVYRKCKNHGVEMKIKIKMISKEGSGLC